MHAAMNEDAEMDAAEFSPPEVRAGPYDGIDGPAWGYRFSETGVAELCRAPRCARRWRSRKSGYG